jgi:trimethylamine-N-oxide reductase (cytochrome c)
MMKQHISRCMIHRAILEGTFENPISWMGTSLLAAPVEDQFQRYYYPIPESEGGSLIHMIWTDSPCNTGCWNNGFHTIEAWRAPIVETVVGQHMWLENDMLLCDLIIPENTKIEEEDIQATTDEFSFAWLMYEGKAIPSVGESMSQMEAVAAMADILGTKAQFMNDRLTVAEWVKYGFDNSLAQDWLSFEEFKEVGYITSPPAADWQEDKAGLIDFYNDPASDPIQLPSGLLEFYSERLAEHFPDDKERWPCARYVEGGPESEGWYHDENPFTSTKRNQYPLVCQTNHPRWRFHVQFDDVPWFREIESDKQMGYDGYMYESLWLHPETAAARGIKHGDIVKMYNDRGIVLYAAYVTEKVHPLVARTDHGARIDPMNTSGPEKTWIDRGGSSNLITPLHILSKNCTGHTVSGFLVEVKKVEPEEMAEWRSLYPDCFARDYDPAYGTLFSGWIEKEA